MMAVAKAGSITSPFARKVRWIPETDSPWTYSMTRKSSAPSTTTSSVDTMLGCRIRDASRASSRNIETNSGSLESCGCRRLIATVRANVPEPLSVPRWTVAIPPAAISSYTAYRPTRSAGVWSVAGFTLASAYHGFSGRHHGAGGAPAW